MALALNFLHAWFSEDSENATGLEVDTLTSTADYSQLIKESTHFVNGFGLCVDLVSWKTNFC